MTQPSGGTPSGAANYGSLAAFADMTQADWEDSIAGPLIAPITNVYNLFGQIGDPSVGQAPAAGTAAHTIPTGTKFVDIIAIGGGGGGGDSDLIFFTGQGGMCGEWVTHTLEKGVDFASSATTFTVTTGAGGAAGQNGQPSIVEYTKPDGSTGVIVAGGGAYGGKGLNHNPANPNPHSGGVGAPSRVYRDTPYYGGADASYGQPGSVPGGGGGGGGIGGTGGPGGRGRIWIKVRAQ